MLFVNSRVFQLFRYRLPLNINASFCLQQKDFLSCKREEPLQSALMVETGEKLALRCGRTVPQNIFCTLTTVSTSPVP